MDTKLIKDTFTIDTQKISWALSQAQKLGGMLLIRPDDGKMFAQVTRKGKCVRIEIEDYFVRSSLPLFNPEIPAMVGSSGWKDKFGQRDGQTKPATQINRKRIDAQEKGRFYLEFMKAAGHSYNFTKQFSTTLVQQWKFDSSVQVYVSQKTGTILEVVENGIPLMETNFWKDWEPTI